jgi:hypothetical protein
MSQEWPSVSVIILAHNRQEKVCVTLEKTLMSLDYPAHLLEVILVDNASSDDTIQVVRRDFPGVQIIASDENIGAAGWNLGFVQAQGEYILILDDDCYLEGASLKRAVAAALQHEAALVSFTIRSTQEKATFNQRFRTGVLSFWGCAALVRRDAIEALNGYDSYIFLWGNELEFTMRLLDAGMRHLFLPEVEAHHMKAVPPPGVYSYASRRLNTRHHAYIAGKLLSLQHTLCVWLRLLRRLLLASTKQVNLIGILPDLIQGAWQGIQNRTPVRPEVSALYVNHFHAFVNQLPFHFRSQALELFIEQRELLYPDTATLLEV